MYFSQGVRGIVEEHREQVAWTAVYYRLETTPQTPKLGIQDIQRYLYVSLQVSKIAVVVQFAIHEARYLCSIWGRDIRGSIFTMAMRLPGS
jgi:hypothetical protein